MARDTIPVDDSPLGMYEALESERRAIRPQYLIIQSVVHFDQQYLCVDVRPKQGRIDENIEGYILNGDGDAWSGQVVVVNKNQILIEIAYCYRLPNHGEEARLYEPDYQLSIRKWSESLIDRGEDLPDAYRQRLDRVGARRFLSLDALATQSEILRLAQRRAVVAAGQALSIVWGPPGTGKTFTLGEIVYALVVSSRREIKILALTTTNLATDTLALAIDKAFTAHGESLRPAELIRPGYVKMPALESRTHLMAWNQVLEEYSFKLKDLREQAIELRKTLRRQNGEQQTKITLELARIKKQIEVVEQERSREFRVLLDKAQIVVTTIMHGLSVSDVAAAFEDPSTPWVLIVDEASMVSRFVLPKLMENNPDCLIIAGDIKQIAPIQRTKGNYNRNVCYWVGDSLFDAVGARCTGDVRKLEQSGHLTMLTEQSRMNTSLCDVVSRAFYGGRLTVVGDPPSPPPWEDWSRASVVGVDALAWALPPNAPVGVTKERMEQGKRCEWSAWIAVGLAQRIVERDLGRRVFLVSPFKYQAWLMKNLVDANLSSHLDRVTASTVHISQGQEADIVIFDPVMPTHRWLMGSMSSREDIERLMCVVFSRARAQVIVLGCQREVDRNPILRQLCADAEWWWNPPWAARERGWC